MTTKFTWYGHAALGLETGGHKLVIDPFLNGNPAASISPEAVEADFILISHGHGDHVGDSVAIAKRTNAMVISNDEIANWFANQGVKPRSEEHTSELQSRLHLVCRLLLEKKKIGKQKTEEQTSELQSRLHR